MFPHIKWSLSNHKPRGPTDHIILVIFKLSIDWAIYEKYLGDSGRTFSPFFIVDLTWVRTNTLGILKSRIWLIKFETSVRGIHAILAKLTANTCTGEYPVHWINGLTTSPKDYILSWFINPTLWHHRWSGMSEFDL